MRRKILNNYNKQKRINGSKFGKIGKVLPILDMNGKYICVGDFVMYGEYKGIALFNPACDSYGIALDYSMWYGDNPYDINSYGKFIEIPMDNGAKLELEIINRT